MKVYVIRHKATGQLMPQMRGGKGYSHWNPTNGIQLTEALGVPRILKSFKQAKACIAQWNALPNARMVMEPDTWYGPGDGYYVDGKSDGRSKDDVEVVEFYLREKK